MSLAVASMTGARRFLAACHRQPVDATPVWFMRQAGRCLPEYRALRERHEMLAMAKTPELAAEVTLMPLRAFAVDGAVLFADIVLPLEGMGVSLEIRPDVGPVIHNPVRGLTDVERLRVPEPEDSVGYVLETLRLLRTELADERAALIGFAGSPYTLACYLVEGKPTRDYVKVKSLMLREPAAWAALMDKLTDVVIGYLRAQAAAGADVVQLFDSWVGSLGPADFQRCVLPWVTRIFAALRGTVPTIYFGTGNAALLEGMADAGSDLVGVDWRVDLAEAWARIGPDRGIQGNLDPVRPVAGWEPTQDGMRAILRQAAGRPGHIFNLGHGVLPETDPAILARLVDAVHEESARA